MAELSSGKRTLVLTVFIAGSLSAGFLFVPQVVHATHLPEWTYTSEDVNARQYPIGLIAYTNLSNVQNALAAAGWHTTTCGYTEYVDYNGAWRAQDVQLERDAQGYCGILGTRKHIRLWQLAPSLVAMAAHLDHTHPNGHQVHDYEGVEGSVANDFRTTSYRAWQVLEDARYLDNYVSYVHDGLTVYNDGYAAEIYPA